MLTKNHLYVVLVMMCCHITLNAAASKQAQSRNLTSPQLIGLALATVCSAAWWANSQHNHSKIGHIRYPFMNRKNILNALIEKETDKEIKRGLEKELEQQECQLALIQGRKNRHNAMRILAAIAGIAAFSGGIYGLQKKKVEADKT